MSSLTNKSLLWLAALLATATLAVAEVKVGEPFPSLANAGLEGSLPDLAGKVVLVDFWATWCGPCKESFPVYSKLQTELAPRGFTILAVSMDKKARDYEEFLDRFAPTFPTMRDGAFKLAGTVRPPGMPTSYLLDKHGVLRAVHSGYHGEGDLKALREEINKLLEEKP
ncbi:MAG: TlpA family protein disulfide reductase [Opitutales bacterium]